MIEPFQTVQLPLVRRIYPQLIANKIVDVQPLLGPTGLVYYLRYRYSQNRQEEPTRRKVIKAKKYRSIDDPWETATR
jgi:hypothetical protein